MLAKPIINNKFWIVEEDGKKVGTIQVGLNGIVYVCNETREHFISLQTLSTKYNIEFSDVSKDNYDKDNVYYELNGYPTSCEPFNGIINLKYKFPVFTKNSKSKSFYCAGYYVIKFNKGWVQSFCPKFVTLSKNEFIGPFKSKIEMKEHLRIKNG